MYYENFHEEYSLFSKLYKTSTNGCSLVYVLLIIV